jgi:uncharacterized protein
MDKKALVVCGGWEEHEPLQKGEIIEEWLKELGVDVDLSHTLEAFEKKDLEQYSIIIPIWSNLSDMTITPKQAESVVSAVARGVGIAGIHNGMHSFPQQRDWHFMTGAYWVEHPGGQDVEYKVNIKKSSGHPIVDGINDFSICSEQFYLHVDPAAEILATTRFPVADGPHASNGEVDIPVIFTKMWGKGRVYYFSIGHKAEDFKPEPTATLIKRGLLWTLREL